MGYPSNNDAHASHTIMNDMYFSTIIGRNLVALRLCSPMNYYDSLLTDLLDSTGCKIEWESGIGVDIPPMAIAPDHRFRMLLAVSGDCPFELPAGMERVSPVCLLLPRYDFQYLIELSLEHWAHIPSQSSCDELVLLSTRAVPVHIMGGKFIDAETHQPIVDEEVYGTFHLNSPKVFITVSHFSWWCVFRCYVGIGKCAFLSFAVVVTVIL